MPSGASPASTRACVMTAAGASTRDRAWTASTRTESPRATGPPVSTISAIRDGYERVSRRVGACARGSSDRCRAARERDHRLPDVGAPKRGQREEERRAAALHALEPDPAAVRLDEALHDRQPEAGTAAPHRPALPEPIEDVGVVLGRDAASGIGDPEQDLRISWSRAHGDQAAARREPGCIADQVLEDLADAV